MEPETQAEVAPESSLEDRIAAKLNGAMGEPEPEAQPEQDATPEPETEGSEPPEPTAIEVEFNGQTYTVPPELKDALMREADYSKKTAELSTTRKTVELQAKEFALLAERQKFEQSVAEDVDRVKMLDAYIKQVESSTDWASLPTDQIMRLRIELDQYKGTRDELNKALSEKRSQFNSQMQAERDKLRSSAQEVLSKAIPSWSEAKGAVEKYVQGLGYPEVAVGNMSAVDYQVAWKAMKYDELQSGKSAALQKAAQKGDSKVVTATARKPMPTETQKFLNYRKKLAKASTTGEAKKIVEDRIGEKFQRIFGG